MVRGVVPLILSDQDIRREIEEGELVIEPFNPSNVEPASLDLRIGNHFKRLDTSMETCISMDKEMQYEEIVADEVVIPPKEFRLATTVEYIELPPSIGGNVQGRSSIGRLGLFTENAGWVDPGYSGEITLELFNANSLPIKVKAGKRVCQMVFEYMDSPCEEPYSGKYVGQSGATGSRVHRDRDVGG